MRLELNKDIKQIFANALALFEEMKTCSYPDEVLACWFYDNEELIDQTIVELKFLLDLTEE